MDPCEPPTFQITVNTPTVRKPAHTTPRHTYQGIHLPRYTRGCTSPTNTQPYPRPNSVCPSPDRDQPGPTAPVSRTPSDQPRDHKRRVCHEFAVSVLTRNSWTNLSHLDTLAPSPLIIELRTLSVYSHRSSHVKSSTTVNVSPTRGERGTHGGVHVRSHSRVQAEHRLDAAHHQVPRIRQVPR